MSLVLTACRMRCDWFQLAMQPCLDLDFEALDEAYLALLRTDNRQAPLSQANLKPSRGGLLRCTRTSGCKFAHHTVSLGQPPPTD